MAVCRLALMRTQLFIFVWMIEKLSWFAAESIFKRLGITNQGHLDQIQIDASQQFFWLFFIIYLLAMSNLKQEFEDLEALEIPFSYYGIEDFIDFKPTEHKSTQDFLFPQLNDINSEDLDFEKHLAQDPIKVNPQADEEGTKRGKNQIEVGRKLRKAYLQAKAGHNSKTNDLSTHIAYLLKSLFSEFEIFYCSSQSDTEFLHEFISSRFNLSSLRKLLGAGENREEKEIQILAEGQSDFGSSIKNKSLQKFKKFLIQQIDSSSIVKKILENKRMSFAKKQIVLKHLGILRKAIEAPNQLRRWGQFLL